MMDDVVRSSVAPRRTNTLLIALFAGLALLLASFGVYAVVSHAMTQRNREFGIRAALGARGADLLLMVGREMASLVAIGVAAGLLGAWLLARLIGSQLYGVTVHDAGTFMVVPLVVWIPVAVATLLPARRALRVSPSEVMREG
jgi:putative ABC transport system permease protein